MLQLGLTCCAFSIVVLFREFRLTIHLPIAGHCNKELASISIDTPLVISRLHNIGNNWDPGALIAVEDNLSLIHIFPTPTLI
ncbi:hypothetical protein WG66_012768 [Moniliophthora roreri]|nr:hypothetical protein WG66_012768 [Moniliophthora roreri]